MYLAMPWIDASPTESKASTCARGIFSRSFLYCKSQCNNRLRVSYGSNVCPRLDRDGEWNATLPSFSNVTWSGNIDDHMLN